MNFIIMPTWRSALPPTERPWERQLPTRHWRCSQSTSPNPNLPRAPSSHPAVSCLAVSKVIVRLIMMPTWRSALPQPGRPPERRPGAPAFQPALEVLAEHLPNPQLPAPQLPTRHWRCAQHTSQKPLREHPSGSAGFPAGIGGVRSTPPKTPTFPERRHYGSAGVLGSAGFPAGIGGARRAPPQPPTFRSAGFPAGIGGARRAPPQPPTFPEHPQHPNFPPSSAMFSDE